LLLINNASQLGAGEEDIGFAPAIRSRGRAHELPARRGASGRRKPVAY
jgi:hypothetical protein